MALDVINSILYILLGAVAGVIYSLRRIFTLERKIDNIDEKLLRIVNKIEKEEEQELRLLNRKKKKR